MSEATPDPQHQIDRLNNIVQALIAQRNNLSDQLVLEQVKVAELSAQLNQEPTPGPNEHDDNDGT